MLDWAEICEAEWNAECETEKSRENELLPSSHASDGGLTSSDPEADEHKNIGCEYEDKNIFLLKKEKEEVNTALDPVRYKTKMCKNWQETGKCPYGPRCLFAHGPREMRSCSGNLDAIALANLDTAAPEEAFYSYGKFPSFMPAPFGNKKSPKKNDLRKLQISKIPVQEKTLENMSITFVPQLTPLPGQGFIKMCGMEDSRLLIHSFSQPGYLPSQPASVHLEYVPCLVNNYTNSIYPVNNNMDIYSTSPEEPCCSSYQTPNLYNEYEFTKSNEPLPTLYVDENYHQQETYKQPLLPSPYHSNCYMEERLVFRAVPAGCLPNTQWVDMNIPHSNQYCTEAQYHYTGAM